MSDKKRAEFLPFHAINEFMRDSYRLTVLRETLKGLHTIDPKHRAKIDRITKKLVTVPGFRNSAKAPAGVKAIAMVKAFEKSAKLVTAILDAWAEINSQLRQETYDLMVKREWELLPIEADREKLPGFLTFWPEGEDYEEIYANFVEDYPESDTGIDDLALMVVWLGGRLPVNKGAGNNQSDDNDDPPEDNNN